MRFFVLTPHNVAVLKNVLIHSFPGIKSGHADEAVAAGIGFGSHAALLAAFKVIGRNRRLVVWVFYDRMDRRLRELGYAPFGASNIAKAFEAAKAPLEQAEDDPFVTMRKWADSVANQN